ncbi:MAG: hypothetical protein OEZ68_00695 [Gammaproteobacteria bacterium]|nr:hypothetical protein [Gammaproteobacteria bacterium]MDH5799296.1 hypothetical protein [Gammaproteobacteria bacterium]
MPNMTRAVVLLSSEQHDKIAKIQKAKKLKSAGEAHRLAIDAFDLEAGDTQDLTALIAELDKSNDEVSRALDHARSEVHETLSLFRKLGKK